MRLDKFWLLFEYLGVEGQPLIVGLFQMSAWLIGKVEIAEVGLILVIERDVHALDVLFGDHTKIQAPKHHVLIAELDFQLDLVKLNGHFDWALLKFFPWRIVHTFYFPNKLLLLPIPHHDALHPPIHLHHHVAHLIVFVTRYFVVDYHSRMLIFYQVHMPALPSYLARYSGQVVRPKLWFLWPLLRVRVVAVFGL